MATWKIEYTGFAYVEADTKEGAENAWGEDELLYEEFELTNTYEVDGFDIEL